MFIRHDPPVVKHGNGKSPIYSYRWFSHLDIHLHLHMRISIVFPSLCHSFPSKMMIFPLKPPLQGKTNPATFLGQVWVIGIKGWWYFNTTTFTAHPPKKLGYRRMLGRWVKLTVALFKLHPICHSIPFGPSCIPWISHDTAWNPIIISHSYPTTPPKIIPSRLWDVVGKVKVG